MITDDENRYRYYLIGMLIEQYDLKEWDIVLHEIKADPEYFAVYVRAFSADHPVVHLCTMGPSTEENLMYDFVVLTERGIEEDLKEWFKKYWPESKPPKFKVRKYEP